MEAVQLVEDKIVPTPDTIGLLAMTAMYITTRPGACGEQGGAGMRSGTQEEGAQTGARAARQSPCHVHRRICCLQQLL